MIRRNLSDRASSPGSRPLILAVALTSAWLAALPSAVEADIVYTWHDDSNEGTSGYLEIASSAQAAGGFTSNDVVSFDFYAGTTFLYPFFTLSPDLVPISTANAGFTSATSVLDSGNALAGFTVDINSNYSVIGGEHWTVSGYDGQYSGSGHWVISGASAIPEPSSLITAGSGLVLVVAGRLMQRWRSRTAA